MATGLDTEVLGASVFIASVLVTVAEGPSPEDVRAGPPPPSRLLMRESAWLATRSCPLPSSRMRLRIARITLTASCTLTQLISGMCASA